MVVRHLIPHTVCRPPERELAQVAGPDDDRVVQIREAKQMRCPLARLHVLERDVIHGFATRVRVTDVCEHLHGGRTDVDLAAGNADRRHEVVSIRTRAIGRCEPRERVS